MACLPILLLALEDRPNERTIGGRAAIIRIASRIILLGRKSAVRNRRPATDPIANYLAPIRLGRHRALCLVRRVLLSRATIDHGTVYQFYGMIRRDSKPCPGNGSTTLDDRHGLIVPFLDLEVKRNKKLYTDVKEIND